MSWMMSFRDETRGSIVGLYNEGGQGAKGAREGSPGLYNALEALITQVLTSILYSRKNNENWYNCYT